MDTQYNKQNHRSGSEKTCLEDEECISLIGKQGSFCLFTYSINLMRDKPGNKGWDSSFGETWYLTIEFLYYHGSG